MCHLKELRVSTNRSVNTKNSINHDIGPIILLTIVENKNNNVIRNSSGLKEYSLLYVTISLITYVLNSHNSIVIE